ncbi:hypothetical protein L9F63_017215, partial [Diploptera punctata]
ATIPQPLLRGLWSMVRSVLILLISLKLILLILKYGIQITWMKLSYRKGCIHFKFGLPVLQLPSGLPSIILLITPFLVILCICLTYLSMFTLISVMISDDLYNSYNFLLHLIRQSPFSLIGPYNFSEPSSAVRYPVFLMLMCNPHFLYSLIHFLV